MSFAFSGRTSILKILLVRLPLRVGGFSFDRARRVARRPRLPVAGLRLPADGSWLTTGSWGLEGEGPAEDLGARHAALEA